MAKPDKNITRLDEGVEPGVWRYAHARRARVIIDAADHFSLMQAAMLQARRRVLMIGWDFDTRVKLAEGRHWWQKGWKDKYPARLGSFLPWLTRNNPELEIRILKWSFGVFKFVVRGSMWVDLLRWWPHKRIDFKFDKAHPVGGSHHQKIAVIDNSFAVCGGIDITVRRWDTREHREHDKRRRTPNRQKYGPWHDASMMMEGEIAQALASLGEDRWIRAGGKPLEAIEPAADGIWPNGLGATFEDVEIGIARTRANYRKWSKVNEIEELFVAHIKRAKRFIYAESQYFASRTIAEAMLARLEEPDPPEICIVHPVTADGWLEAQAMDNARAELARTLQEADHADRFSLWVPYAGDTPIYVHAKIMVVDDEVIRIGSANFNNRSMGLDSECDVFIDTARPVNSGCGEAIRGLRLSLIAEHCGLDESEVGAALEEAGGMAALFARRGDNRPRHVRRYHPPQLGEVEEKLAQSQLLDPEEPDDLFAPYADGGMFRFGSRLKRVRDRIRRRRKRS